jgi:hypothetical protein
MVPDGDAVPVCKGKVRFVPFEDELAPLVFPKKNLGAKESDLEPGKVIPLTFESGDPASVVKDLVTQSAPLMSNQLPSDTVKRKGRWKIDKRPGHKIGEARAHALGAPGVNNQLEVVIL